MPIYEYRRPDGTTFEVTQSFSDDALTHDPDTGVEVRRVLHAPAVHFKGSGFYNTDYGTRRRQRENAAGDGGGESSGGDGGKSESAKGEGGKGESGKGESSGKDGGASSKDSGGSSKDGGNGGKSKDSAAKSSSSGGKSKSEPVGA